MKIKNKRGDIPITILVIGVLAICALAIFSFYTSSQKVKSGFDSIGVVNRAVVDMQKISLYEELGFDDGEIKTIFGVQPDKVGRLFIGVTQGGISVKHFLPPD
ncbi:MAG: hypothetical protein KJ879_03300 [Nanoarchaeota archaeon]|nr:hypothetical protein [Nanoarchaeota archaeon]